MPVLRFGQQVGFVEYGGIELDVADIVKQGRQARALDLVRRPSQRVGQAQRENGAIDGVPRGVVIALLDSRQPHHRGQVLLQVAGQLGHYALGGLDLQRALAGEASDELPRLGVEQVVGAQGHADAVLVDSGAAQRIDRVAKIGGRPDRLRLALLAFCPGRFSRRWRLVATLEVDDDPFAVVLEPFSGAVRIDEHPLQRKGRVDPGNIEAHDKIAHLQVGGVNDHLARPERVGLSLFLRHLGEHGIL